jgi:hypothetical protein
LEGLIGKIFADRGYLGKDFFESLWKEGIQIITRIRKNMKNKLMPLWDRFYLDKRMTKNRQGFSLLKDSSSAFLSS